MRRTSWMLALALGAGCAFCATLGIRQFGFWVIPAVLGLSACLGAAFASDFHAYWLAIYTLVLPFEIKKMLVDSSVVKDFVLRYGFPVGEPPGPILYLSDIALAMLVARWLFEVKTKDSPVLFPRSNLVALAFITWAALSVVNAPNIPSSIFELTRMFKLYLLFLYAANNLSTPARIHLVVACILIGTVLQGLLCAGQFFTGDRGFLAGGVFSGKTHLPAERARQISSFFAVSGANGPAQVRASGTAGASDAEAQYFEFMLPLAFTLSMVAGARLRKTAVVALASGAAGLLLTFSRGGLIGLAAGLVLATLLAFKFRLIRLKTFAMCCLLGCMGVVVATPFLYRYLTTRPEAVTARFHLNQVGVEMIKTHPIAGVGLNNHLVVKSRYDSDYYVVPLATHNHYLLVASQVGIPGALLFIALIVCFVRAFLGGATRGDPYSSAISLGLLGGVISVCVHGFADYIGTYANMSLLWLYGGLGEALGLARKPAGTPAA